MKGIVCQWNDEKGFGFITPDGSADRVFFHISATNLQGMRPKVNDSVYYEVDADSSGRKKAIVVHFEHDASGNDIINNVHNTQHKNACIVIKPIRKNVFDYVAMLVACVCLLAAIYMYFTYGNLVIPTALGIVAMSGFAYANRTKTPESKVFSCTKCKAISMFDNRTIRAWNAGCNKFYCTACHSIWIRSQQEKSLDSHEDDISRGSGCLSVCALIIFLPICSVIMYSIFV
ncbi:cold shock domain-containing protein [Plesiomonas shigelloides]|jgi:cold shock CspA family protein